MNNYWFLGIVQNDQFKLLRSEHASLSEPTSGDSFRLTSIARQAAESPESGEIDLVKYGGSAIMVRGIDGEGWIYSAVVVDQAGPILTAVVQQVFSARRNRGSGLLYRRSSQ